MTSPTSVYTLPGRTGRATLRWLAGWWRIVHFSALVLALSLSPGTYRRAHRAAMAQKLVLDIAPNLAWFIVLSSLISLVLIRIVVVTAVSYGLSQYALEMVVRVLVLELIPLTAALFAAMRCTLPDGVELSEMRARGELDALRRDGTDPLYSEFLPRAMAGVCTVLMLAALSCVIALVLSYLNIYGFTQWALAGYSRVVGRVFNPGVAMILALKTVLFSLAVSLIPMASAYYGVPLRGGVSSDQLAAMVRVFSVVLLIEIAALVGNYY
jgi:phospholipid/cholesterol/gamma-HCH transport system permease protein